MKLKEIKKIEIVQTNQGAWTASIPQGAWSCQSTPEKALKTLLEFIKKIKTNKLSGWELIAAKDAK